ncbi:MAG: DinB family protein [Dehalococcoidia bacterium]
MRDLIEDFYRQNEWANLRLIEVCRALTDDQLDATGPGAFGSIRDTLVHLVGAEAGNVRRLGGNPVHTLASRGAAWPGFDALEDVIRSSAEALIERARAVGGTAVVLEEGRARVEIEANVLLVQAINHSTEHRSQICTILTMLDALPSDGDEGQTIVDAWAWSDALDLARRLD